MLRKNGLNNSYGENNGNNVYKEKDIIQVCELLENDISMYEISSITGVSYPVISLVYRKKIWTNVSDNYDFSNYNYGRTRKYAIIVKICELLENTDKSVLEISKICNVKRSKVYDVLRGKYASISSKYDFTCRKYNL